MSNQTTNNLVIGEISKAIKSLFDLTSRIDERVKMLMEKQQENSEKLSDISKLYNDLMQKVAIIESKNGDKLHEEINKLESNIDSSVDKINENVKTLQIRVSLVEKSTQGTEARWKTIIDLGFKALATAIMCYILWKLGLPSQIL